MMAQAFRAAQSRYQQLVSMGLIDPFAGLVTREGGPVLRHMMWNNDPARRMPDSPMPNVYRGKLAPHGIEQQADPATVLMQRGWFGGV